MARLQRWMICIEGHILCEGIQPTFLTGLAALFSTYYIFKLQYQEEAAGTLVFSILYLKMFCLLLCYFLDWVQQLDFTHWRNIISFQTFHWNKPRERHQDEARQSGIKEIWQSHYKEEWNSQPTCVHSAQETYGFSVGLHLNCWDELLNPVNL